MTDRPQQEEESWFAQRRAMMIRLYALRKGSR